MSTGIILAITFGAILASILIGYKTNINIGFIAMGFAYIIGTWVLGINSNTIISYWPVTITVQFISILGFYGYAFHNGTLNSLALHILYPFRKFPQILPFVITLVTLFLGAMAGQTAANGFMPLLTFTIAMQAGWHPALFALICCTSAVVGASVPFSQTGVLIAGALAETEYAANAELMTWKISMTSWLVLLLMVAVLYVILGAYKIKKVEMEKPAPYTPQQKKNLVIIAIVLFLLVIPSLCKYLLPGSFLAQLSGNINISLVYILGFLACAFFKLGDQRKVINNSIPWYFICMIAGVSILVAIATNSGASEFLGTFIGTNVPKALIGPFFVLMAGAFSFFAAFYLTFPIMFPLVFPICAATGLNPIMLLTACFFGSICTSISPFSNGGMIVLGQQHDEAIREKQFVWQIYLAIYAIIFCVLASLTGIMGILH